MGKDIYKEAVSFFLDKPVEEVSKEERQRMKKTLYNFLYSGDFQSRLPDYVRDAFSREIKEYNLMDSLAKIFELQCQKCGGPLEAGQSNNDHYIFYCCGCHHDIVVKELAVVFS